MFSFIHFKEKVVGDFICKHYLLHVTTVLSPCGYFLFLKIRNQLLGNYFESMENSRNVLIDQLKNLLYLNTSRTVSVTRNNVSISM